MQNTDKSLLQDALELCDKAIRTKDDNDNFKKGFREISIGSVKTHEFQMGEDESILYYKYPETPELLRQNGVLDYFYWPDNDSYKKKSLGYHKVGFDYETAKEWIDKTIHSSISEYKPKARIEFDGTNVDVHLKNDDVRISFDTSRGKNDMKEVFAVLFNQYNQGNNIRLKKSEIALLVAKKRKIDVDDLPINFVKYAVSHINQRFGGNEKIKGLIEITSKNNEGYLIEVR